MEIPTFKDIQWAKKHGWIWEGDQDAFIPEKLFSQKIENSLIPKGPSESFIRVIPAPLDRNIIKGWCPWLSAIGALQLEAPFGSVRAALRVAEAIRQQRSLDLGEMDCSKD